MGLVATVSWPTPGPAIVRIPHRVASFGVSDAPTVPSVENSPDGLVCKPPEPSLAPPPGLFLSDWPPMCGDLRLPSVPLLGRTLVIREAQADKVMIKLAEITLPVGFSE